MLCRAEWLLCDDDIVRPVLRAEVLASNNRWEPAEFLLDTGADRTVLSANILAALGPMPRDDNDRISGVGGIIETVVVRTQIRLTRDEGNKIIFRGAFAACTDPELLDMSVLGRDILDLFTLIVDRKTDFIGLLRGQHDYKIVVDS